MTMGGEARFVVVALPSREQQEESWFPLGAEGSAEWRNYAQDLIAQILLCELLLGGDRSLHERSGLDRLGDEQLAFNEQCWDQFENREMGQRGLESCLLWLGRWGWSVKGWRDVL